MWGLTARRVYLLAARLGADAAVDADRARDTYPLDAKPISGLHDVALAAQCGTRGVDGRLGWRLPAVISSEAHDPVDLVSGANLEKRRENDQDGGALPSGTAQASSSMST